ncbi:unnamed protein product [Didymodactylos carnosus]|uniref:Uncharacterized protein n=1 Tax=Didymodactylos carnosus TaxID=1234261 RepID=A0A815SD35_9BILA|nr:unnamed protein product [Didymodactylos carnosus]CAF4352107.1 unnamed protein product [Didymodactylos carnosus]
MIYKTFIQQALGQSWQQAIKYVPVDKLYDIANELWTDKSGFDLLLKQTIKKTIDKAVPICLCSALDKSISYIDKWREKIAIRRNCLNIDEKPLLEELQHLTWGNSFRTSLIAQGNSVQKVSTNSIILSLNLI